MFSDRFSFAPIERMPAVEAALLQCFPGAAVTGLTLLAGGLSGSFVYKIVAGDSPYILKLNPPHEAGALPADALQLASSAGVAPRLYYHDPLQGIVITDFVDNKPIRSALKPEQLVNKLAEKIKTVHSIPFHKQGNDLFLTVDGLIGQFRDSNKLSGPVFEEGFGYYEALKDKYPRVEADKVFSHNDLNPNNILCDGEDIWIIDWDVASFNDRYIDLANAANYFVHTEELERSFLRTYFNQEASDYQLACFYVMRQVCRIIYSMMMLQLAIKSKPADFGHNQEMEGMDMPAFGALMGAGKLSLAEYEGQLMYGKVLMNTAVQQMRTARFAAALAQF